MKKNLILVLLILFLVTIVSLPATSASECLSSSQTTVSIRLKQNDNMFSVDISNVSDLFGYDLKIVWDPVLLSLEHATNTPPWSTYFIVLENNSEGSYQLVVISLHDHFSGSASLFTLQFNILKVGSTTINFSIAKLADGSIPVPKPISAKLEPYYCPVTLADIGATAYYLGSTNSRYDLDNNRIVDMSDLQAIASLLGT